VAADQQEATSMRGRRPAGPEYVDQLDGSELAKERLKVVLQTLAGECRVRAACERLGICEQRFHQIRDEALRAALAGLEPRPSGRPAQSATSQPLEQQALLDQVEQLEVQLHAARVREEIALTLPQHTAASQEKAEPEKKTRRRRAKKATRQRNRRAKKNT
jgi:hypothetical protein